MKWNFNAQQGAEELKNNGYKPIPVGDHRVRIEECEEKLSSTGKAMYRIVFAVSNYNSKLFYYFVFDDTSPDAIRRTNGNIARMLDSFNLFENEISNPKAWVGKTGAVRVKHTIYNGEEQATVARVLLQSEQIALAPWNEGEKPTDYNQTFTINNTGDDLEF